MANSSSKSTIKNDIRLTHPRIIEFYHSNPTLNIETVNLLFIDLIGKFKTDTTSGLESQYIHLLNENTNAIQHSIMSLQTTLLTMKQENQSNMISKIEEMKRDYIENSLSIFTSATEEKVGSLFAKNNQELLNKTSIMIAELSPTHKSQLQESLGYFQKSVADDTANLLKTSIDTNSIKEFIHNFEMKISAIIQNLQQPVYSFIAASEERLHSNLNVLKESHLNNQNIQAGLSSNITDLIQKFQHNEKDASNKTIQNRQLSSVLNKMYKSAEIIIQPAALNAGSVLLKRMRKQNILFENKEYQENISVDEVNLFNSMIEENSSNGIFISQNSGISSKQNFQIDIIQNNIVVFLHNVGYNPDIIVSAVDIIDNLSNKFRIFKDTYKNEEFSVPKEVLDTINIEYQMFLTQKNAVVELLKENQKKILTQIEEIRFPGLDKFLSTKYSAHIQKTGLKCDLCKAFNANNLKALAAHKRGCNRKNASVAISVPNAGFSNALSQVVM